MADPGAIVIAAEQRGWSRAVIFFSGTGLIVAIAGSRLWAKTLHMATSALVSTTRPP